LPAEGWVVGVATLNHQEAAGPGDAPESLLVRKIWEQALTNWLDLLEYRIELKVRSRQKYLGPRLIPGCSEIPLKVQTNILVHFGGRSLGVREGPGGTLIPPFSLAFLYPLKNSPEKEKEKTGDRCQTCTLACPRRSH
jgi:hypothetical protein